jgi:hypothetical protein
MVLVRRVFYDAIISLLFDVPGHFEHCSFIHIYTMLRVQHEPFQKIVNIWCTALINNWDPYSGSGRDR